VTLAESLPCSHSAMRIQVMLGSTKGSADGVVRRCWEWPVVKKKDSKPERENRPSPSIRDR